MAFTLVGQGAASTANNQSSLNNVAYPASTQAYDIAFLQFQCFGGTNTRQPSIGNPGWNQIAVWQSGGSTGPWHGLFYKLLVGSDATPTVTLTGGGATGDTQLARIVVFRPGANNAAALNVTGSTSTNSSADNVGPITGITPTSGDLVIMSGGKANDWNGASTAQSGWSKTSTADTESTSGNDAGMFLHYILNSGGSATGNLTVPDDGSVASTGLGMGIMVSVKQVPFLAPTGSQVTVQIPSTAIAEYLYVPRTDGGGPGGETQGSAQSGSPSLSLGGGINLAPSGIEVTSQTGLFGGAGGPAFRLHPTGSEGTAQSGTPILATARLATGSEATGQTGTAVVTYKLLPTGSQPTAQSGTATIQVGGGPITVTPAGSQSTVQIPGAPIVEYLYLPKTDGTGPGGLTQGSAQSGTPVLGQGLRPTGSQGVAESGTAVIQAGPITFSPEGSQVAAQTGAPAVQQFAGLVIPGGSQVGIEIPPDHETFWDLIPDPSEVAAQTGTPFLSIPMTVPATGSQVPSESSAAQLAFRLLPLGPQVSAETGLAILPNLAIVPLGAQVTAQTAVAALLGTYPGLGSQASAQSGNGLVAYIVAAVGSEVAAQSGTPGISQTGILFSPQGVERTTESGFPAVRWFAIPAGVQLTVQTGGPLVNPSVTQFYLVFTGASEPRYYLLDVSCEAFHLEGV